MLLLQAPLTPEQLATAASILQKQSGQTTDLLRDYGALVNLLYFGVGVLSVIVVYLVWFIMYRLSTVATAVDTAVKAVAEPIEKAYEKLEKEVAEKHAQEIRANETHHQAQLSSQAAGHQLQIAAMIEQIKSLNSQLETEREDRRKLTETANNAYREMNDIVAPFTQSNHALAGRMHDVEKTLLQFGNQIEDFAKKTA